MVEGGGAGGSLDEGPAGGAGCAGCSSPPHVLIGPPHARGATSRIAIAKIA
jgi:hypothetical protein